jgi:hypothetical protein
VTTKTSSQAKRKKPQINREPESLAGAIPGRTIQVSETAQRVPGQSQKRQRVNAIKDASVIAISVGENDEPGNRSFLAIVIHGPAAKIPSTSNSRLTYFPKAGIVADLRNGNIKGALLKLGSYRVISMKAPAHEEHLEALRELWDEMSPEKGRYAMGESAENRLFVQIFLPKVLNRGDSHNYSKPIMDWLQDVGVIENDRHVDSLILRTEEFLKWSDPKVFERSETIVDLNREATIILIKRQAEIRKQCAEFVSHMMRP